ncbi:MAG: hypothetical protein U9R19_17590, partial [Bacteroidota bacterium]|nr:hypothetical protein [Bacteroidota bacterium]
MWAMNRGEASDEWLSANALGQSLADEKAYVDYYKFMCPAFLIKSSPILPGATIKSKSFLLIKASVSSILCGVVGFA